LVARDVCPGLADIRRHVRLRGGLRQGLKGPIMLALTSLTAVVTGFLLVYLFAALVRPEWF
jgi:K+-transporting ATPase KdpF subunit